MATDWIFDRDSTFKNAFSLSNDYYFASNAITNEFALQYFQNGFIDNEMKSRVESNLEDHNRFGIDFITQLKYTSLNKTIFSLPNSFYSISLNNRYHVNSEFTSGAFKLYFKGNKEFRNKIVGLSDFKYNQVFYQQLNFTFGHKYKIDENKFGYAAGLSFNKGQKLYEISSDRASLFTENDGIYLDLDANLKIHQSDSSSESDLSAFNGAGASADLYWFWTNKKNNTLKISATNFGFINWNSQTAFISADTSFRFNGVDVTDLFLFSDSLRENISLDSSLVQPYLSAREKNSYFYMLPALVDVSYEYKLPHEMSIEAGINYMFFAGYNLREYLTFTCEFYKHVDVSVRFSYGGYSDFNAGLGFSALILKRLRFTAQSDYLSSMLNPQSGTGQGAFVSLTGYF